MIKDGNILIKNIYYMLAYAYDTLTPSICEDVRLERFDSMHDMFAHVLARRLSTQLKQGLYKTYRSQIREMSAVRGKLYMPGTMQCRMQRKCTVSCQVDELTENNLFNQIIKTTVLLLLRHPRAEKACKGELKKEMMYFSNVDVISPQTIRWDMIRFQRQNRSYRLLLAVCRLILEGMLLTTESGHHRMFSFREIPELFQEGSDVPEHRKINDLYERFVRKYYQQEFRQFPGFSCRDETMLWQEAQGHIDLLPKMHTDITLTYDRKVLIIDTKYYQHIVTNKNGRSYISPDNLYQIFAYVKNKEAFLNARAKPDDTLREDDEDDKLWRVEGMLLYASTEELLLPDKTYDLMGSKISIKTLDLNADFEDIRRQLDDIVEKYFGLRRDKK